VADKIKNNGFNNNNHNNNNNNKENLPAGSATAFISITASTISCAARRAVP